MIAKGSISKTVKKGMTNDQNGAVRKPVYENSEDCVSPLSPAVVFGTIPASRLQTVFSITHPDHSIKRAGSSAITEIEMLTSPK
jgi:hypothetical protein